MTAQWSLLRHTVPFPFRAPVRILIILQRASTVLGILALIAWVGAWDRRTKPVREAAVEKIPWFRKSAVALTIAVIAVLVGNPLAIFRLAGHKPPISPLFFVATMLEAMTLVICFQLLIYGLTRTLGVRVPTLASVQLDEHDT